MGHAQSRSTTTVFHSRSASKPHGQLFNGGEQEGRRDDEDLNAITSSSDEDAKFKRGDNVEVTVHMNIVIRTKLELVTFKVLD